VFCGANYDSSGIAARFGGFDAGEPRILNIPNDYYIIGKTTQKTL